MNNFAKNVLEMEQVKDLVSKIKGEPAKKKNLNWLWILLAVVVVAAAVAFFVVRFFRDKDEYLEDDEWNLEDEDDEDEDDKPSLAENVKEAVSDVNDAVTEGIEDLKD